MTALRRRVRAAAAVVVLPSSAAVGCTDRAPQTHTVTVSAFAYLPDTLVVARGDTVIWANDDLVPHTATARDAGWDSQVLARGGRWRLVAERTGRHRYYCVYHPTMQGVLEVR